MKRIPLTTFKELFRAYTKDQEALRALNLNMAQWTSSDECKTKIGARLAEVVKGAEGFLRYSELQR